MLNRLRKLNGINRYSHHEIFLKEKFDINKIWNIYIYLYTQKVLKKVLWVVNIVWKRPLGPAYLC